MTTALRSSILPTFAVAINGVHRFTMGIERDGVMSVHIDIVRRDPTSYNPDRFKGTAEEHATPYLCFASGGLLTQVGADLHARWDDRDLCIGDVVTIAVREPDTFDPPALVYPESTDGAITEGYRQWSAPWPDYATSGVLAEHLDHAPHIAVDLNAQPLCVTSPWDYGVIALCIGTGVRRPKLDDPSRTPTVETYLQAGPRMRNAGPTANGPYHGQELTPGDTLTIRVLDPAAP